MTENDRTTPTYDRMPKISSLRAELGNGEITFSDEELQQLWWILCELAAVEMTFMMVQGKGPLSQLLENSNVPQILQGAGA